MKKIILSIALVSTTFAFSQKKEIAAAFKAIDAGDVATANSQIAAAEAIMGDKTYLLDPATLEQYYYTKGSVLMKAGKTAEGASYLSKIADLGKNKIYSGKDASKNKVYYVGKTAADASGIQGLKEETFAPTTSAKLGNIINPIIQSSNKEAVDAYNAKKFELAGDKFLEVYNLLKAAGQINGQILYNAGLSYSAATKYDKASAALTDLINSGYTGVETTYTAKNKKTGQVEELDKTSYEIYQKTTSGDYTDFKTSTTKSIEQELYETNAAVLSAAGKYDDALAMIDRGLKKFPKSTRLMELQSDAYFKAGKMDQFLTSLKAKVAQNPNDYESWYNLGVLTSKDNAKTEEAVGYFNKAVEINPKFAPAFQNLAYITMGDDDAAVKGIEAAKKAGKGDLFNKLLNERRARFAKTIPYAEKWYEADPNNLDAVTLLKNLYNSAHNDAKYNEFKAKEAALKAQQK